MGSIGKLLQMENKLPVISKQTEYEKIIVQLVQVKVRKYINFISRSMKEWNYLQTLERFFSFYSLNIQGT